MVSRERQNVSQFETQSHIFRVNAARKQVLTMFRATSCSKPPFIPFKLRRFGRCVIIVPLHPIYTFICERFDLLALSLSLSHSLNASRWLTRKGRWRGRTRKEIPRRGFVGCRITVYACDCVPTLICEPRIPFLVHKANLIERYVRPDALSLMATDGPGCRAVQICIAFRKRTRPFSNYAFGRLEKRIYAIV